MATTMTSSVTSHGIPRQVLQNTSFKRLKCDLWGAAAILKYVKHSGLNFEILKFLFTGTFAYADFCPPILGYNLTRILTHTGATCHHRRFSGT